MSGLFHRRTRSASATPQPTHPHASNSAHAAATQAFMSSRASQGNLSASAAAAALRAMSPPPTQVGDIQTKRMQRRASDASRSQSPRGRPTGGLERQSSNGSMTERTFRRSPSPGRPNTPGRSDHVPPVPQLPQDIPEPPQFRKQAQRRAASLETASKRVYSPATRTFVEVPAARPSPSTIAARIVSQPRPNGLERSDSRNSINFSYPRPMSPPMSSPTSSRGTQQLPQTLRSPTAPQHDPHLLQSTRNGISPAQAETARYDVTHAAQQPVKKKKKKIAPQATEGSHFQRGSMEPRPVTTPLGPGPDLPPQTPPDPVQKKKKKAAVTGESSHFPSDGGSSQASDSDSALDNTRRTQRASGVLQKQPSVVREDWEGEQEQVQTHAQQREEQGLSPVSSPASVLGKKTTAANMSRKIEEPQAPAKQPPTQAYHAVTTDEPASPTIISAPSEQLLQVQQPEPRTASLSPSRATRFSDRLSSDLASGKKHDPLPRSYSPVKSALKHHNQDGSLADPTRGVRESSLTPSDASDSNMSADGSIRRRQSARVSFEPAVEVMGTAAEPQQTDSPTITSPQNKDSGKRGFFGLGRSRPALTTIPSEEDIEEHMKPRPQLPSFGSVRSRPRRSESSESNEATASSQKLTPQAAATPSSSSLSSSSDNAQAKHRGVSSDHAIGGLLAQQVASQAQSSAALPPQTDPNLPLPPEVTSVEGSGYVSNSESEVSDEDVLEPSAPSAAAYPTKPAQSAPATLETEEPPVSRPTEPSKQEIPAVAVHPPTPRVEQTNQADLWAIEVPGGFPEVTPQPSPGIEKQGTLQQSGLGIVEPPAATSEPFESPPAQPVEVLQPQPFEESEEDVDNASIYSDAAEDLSDVEGDGFGSINAIVESPIVASSHSRQVTTPPQSPLIQSSERPQGGDRTTSWDEAQQKWSGIAKQTRESTTQQPVSQSVKQTGLGLEDSKWAQAPPQLQPSTVLQKPKKKKKKSPAATAAAIAPSAGMRHRLYDSPPRTTNQSAAYPTVDNTNRASGPFRQSMRTQAPSHEPPQPGFRSSLRGQQPSSHPETGFRSSMRGQPPPVRPKSPPQASPAPVSPSPPRAALQKKHIPPAVTTQARAPPAPSKLARTFSNDSDSDSSFQRTRRSKPSSGGNYNMRRSMRAGAGPQSVPLQPAGRGTVRSLSPPRRRPFSPVGGESAAFRTTMRGSLDHNAPTLRNQPEQKRSSSLFGRQKAKSPSPALARQPVSRVLQSRIKADSDDEDVPRPTTFRSRFQDSSDDEESEPHTFRPVRGIPRKTDEGDSTDLDDSSDEEKKAQKAKVQPLTVNTTAPNSTAQGADPASPTSPTKKKGFLSRFRSKKDKEVAPRSEIGIASTADEANEGEGKEDGMGNMGFGSTAERDEMIRQTMARLEAAKQDEGGQTSASVVPEHQRQGMGQRVMSSSSVASQPPREGIGSRVVGGSLVGTEPQRQGMGQRVMSDSWPLPAKPDDTDNDRPATSAGVPTKTNGTAIRPELGTRISSMGGTGTSTAAYGRAGKKKRFPMLRKAFGLKD